MPNQNLTEASVGSYTKTNKAYKRRKDSTKSSSQTEMQGPSAYFNNVLVTHDTWPVLTS